MQRFILRLRAMILLICLGIAAPAYGQTPYPDMIRVATPHAFPALWERVSAAVLDHEMFLVGRASASRAAASRGITIPGNGIIDVFRNDFAIRMLAADVNAGFEAPIRFYLTANADGTATLSYRPPSALFAPYDNADLDAMAAELDAIFASIAAQAAATEE